MSESGKDPEHPENPILFNQRIVVGDRIVAPSHAEIAEAAGVSRSMVSAFLSGTQYKSGSKRGTGVGKESALRIRQACADLGYMPGDPAIIFRLYPEKAPIGLFLGQSVPGGVSSPVHSLIFEGIAQRANEEGVELSTLLFDANIDYLLNPTALPRPIQRGGIKKAIIVGGALNYSLLHSLTEQEVAVVIIGKAPKIRRVVSVVPDLFEAARTAIGKLYDHGHRNIAVVMDWFAGPNTYNGRIIRDGCLHAMRELKLPFTENDIIVQPSPRSESPKAVEQILSRNPLPTAIFCLHGETARAVAADLAMEGLQIPENMSLIVGDDDIVNQTMHRGFSGIHLHYRRMGRRAFDEVNELAAHGEQEEERTLVFSFDYVDRGSLRRVSES